MRSVSSHIVVAVLAAGLTFAMCQFLRPFGGSGQAKEKRAEPHSPVLPASPPLPEIKISAEEKTNIQVYRRVNRSVVNITTRSVAVDDFLLLAQPRSGSGSGSVLDKQGYILTNYHVVEGARRMAVTLYDGSVWEAKFQGADPNNDLAVLKIKAPADKLAPIHWGDSSKLAVGMEVYALGNPFGLERTLTKGIISSLNRSLRSENNRLIRGMIQTDAAINPGNSGGPLLNRQGQMIGITTAIIGRAQQNSGIGLAIPASAARRIVSDLIEYGRVIRPSTGILQVYELDKGLLIARLAPGGPAEKAGLRGPTIVIERRGGFIFRSLDHSKADLIVAVDGKSVTTFDEFLSYVESKKAGDQVTLTIIREGKKMEVALTLATGEAGN